MRKSNQKSSKAINQVVEFLRRAKAKQPLKNRMALYYLEKSPAHFLAYCFVIRSLKVLLPSLRKPTSVVAITVPTSWPISMFESILEKTLQIDDAVDPARYRYSIYVHLQARDLKKSGTDETVIKKLAHKNLVVLVPAGTALMPELDLVVEQEVEVAIGVTRDFAALARLRKTGEVSETAAAVLREQPPSHLTAIFRNGHPLKVSLARIQRRVQTNSAYDREKLTLDEVPGFGSAARWGRTLQRDVGHWRAGKLPWSDVDKGLLMIGPPGTGKTMFAQILANTCRMSFFPHSLPQWQKLGHMGDLLKGMNSAFRIAQEHAPSLLFLDELDSIGDRRTFSGDNEGYQTEVLNALLELVDGSISREGVIVAGATNFPEKIDAALLRSGRLEKHIVFENPDAPDRAEILQFYLPDLAAAEVAEFAERLNGWSPADLERLSRNARRRAREKGRAVSLSDLTSELPVKVPLSENDLQRIAIHEAGHAAVAMALGLELKRVSINRDIDPVNRSLWLGVTTTARFSKEIRGKRNILDEINLMLAGTAAEEVFFNERTTFAAGQEEGDLFEATQLAFELVAKFGLGERLFVIPGQSVKNMSSDESLRNEVDDVLRTQFDLVTTILQRLHNEVFNLSEALLAEGELSGRKALEIFVGDGSVPDNAANVP